MEKIIAVNDLRQKMGHYADKVKTGQSFIVVKKSHPLFRIGPIETDEQWEEVIDFTKIQKGGININDLLERL